MKQLQFLLTVLLVMTALVSCDSSSDQPAQSVVRPVSSTDLRLTTGQTVYVPAYAEEN